MINSYLSHIDNISFLSSPASAANPFSPLPCFNMPAFASPTASVAASDAVLDAAAEPTNAPRSQSQVPTRPGDSQLSVGWCDPHSAVAPAANHGEDIVQSLLRQAPGKGVMASQESPCLKRRLSYDDPFADDGDVSHPQNQQGKSIVKSYFNI